MARDDIELGPMAMGQTPECVRLAPLTPREMAMKDS